MSLFPVAMTQVNWQRLCDAWGDNTPIKILDNQGSEQSDPSSFYRVLKELDPLAGKHVSISFAYQGSEDVSWLGCHGVAISKGEEVTILTASLFVWYTCINELCPELKKSNRIILNAVFIHLRDMGFNLWKYHNKIELKDGTFYMKGT